MTTIKENLIDLFQLDKMPPEKAVEMVERLAKLVFQAVLVRVLPELSKEDFEKYEKLVDGKSDGEELFNFFREKVPNFDKIVQEEAETLHNELAQKM